MMVVMVGRPCYGGTKPHDGHAEDHKLAAREEHTGKANKVTALFFYRKQVPPRTSVYEFMIEASAFLASIYDFYCLLPLVRCILHVALRRAAVDFRGLTRYRETNNHYHG